MARRVGVLSLTAGLVAALVLAFVLGLPWWSRAVILVAWLAGVWGRLLWLDHQRRRVR